MFYYATTRDYSKEDEEDEEDNSNAGTEETSSNISPEIDNETLPKLSIRFKEVCSTLLGTSS